MSAVILDTGSRSVELVIPPGKLVQTRQDRLPPANGDLRQAATASLETPIEFPPLRRALTPDDHIAVLVDEEVHGLSVVMECVLDHVLSAGLQIDQVTVLVTKRPPDTEVHWIDQLPEALRGFQIEEHDPAVSKMAYLASTKAGRRIYLNRSIVDAAQLIIVGKVRFDPVFGVATGLADLFPAFSDEPTLHELTRHLHETLPPHHHPFPIWKEAEEVGWQLGMPFVICVIEGRRDSVHQVLAGASGAVKEQAETWLRSTHVIQLPYQVDLVVGTLAGVHQTFAQVCQAAYQARRLVHQGGKIAILSEAGSVLPEGAGVVSQAESAVAGLTLLRTQPNLDARPWWYLAHALAQARVYLSSHLQQEVVESLFLVPFDQPGQVQNLIDQSKSVLVVEALDQVHGEVRRT